MTAGREAERSTSAARVYLFADFGKGPRCYWRGIGHPLDERTAGAHRDLPTDNVIAILGNASEARTWWLVECETASDGRKIIAGERQPIPAGGACAKCGRLWNVRNADGCPDCPAGRILDKGGASV